jgi:hypothetical protein
MFPGVPQWLVLIPISRRERGPEARRQRVVPPLAAGVFLAGLVVDAGIIGTTFVSS